MNKKTQMLGFGALCASAAFYACADDSTPSGGALDSGTPAIDASLADAAQSDASSSDGATGTDTGSDAGVDSAVDAGPWCGALDSGALCASHEWAHFPADAGADADSGPTTCSACPTTPLTCTSAVLALSADGGLTFTPPSYSVGTHLLMVTLPPGQRQIVSVTNATVVVSSSCFGGPPSTASGPQSVPASVDGDTITFDLGGTDGGSGTAPCGVITFTAQDACCTTSNVTVTAYWDSEGGGMKNGSCPDGG